MREAPGQFVWFDLQTTDPKGAKAFYSEILGWKTSPSEQSGYEMWVAQETSVGGLMALPEEARKAGAPPFWLTYVSTKDVDATANKARQLGGRVLEPPKDIPKVGRFAVLSDPQGAAFALFTPFNESDTPPGRDKLGHFGWNELNTTDWKAAWTFYSELFGWKPTQSMDMGADLGEYFMFGPDPKTSIGGMSNAAHMMKAPPHWLPYVNVRNIDEAVQRIPQKGGQVLNGPMEVPGGDRIAQCMDPQGGMFAVFASGQK